MTQSLYILSTVFVFSITDVEAMGAEGQKENKIKENEIL
jgi:hypothetical protein